MSDKSELESNPRDGSEAGLKNAAQKRQDTMLKLGRFAAYTAPALLARLSGTAFAQGDSLTPV